MCQQGRIYVYRQWRLWGKKRSTQYKKSPHMSKERGETSVPTRSGDATPDQMGSSGHLRPQAYSAPLRHFGSWMYYATYVFPF